jgi:hypothetical protein
MRNDRKHVLFTPASPLSASFVHLRNSVLGGGILSSWAAGAELEVFFPTTAAAVLGGAAGEAGLTELEAAAEAMGTRVGTLMFAGVDGLLPTVTHAPPPDVVCGAYVTSVH